MIVDYLQILAPDGAAARGESKYVVDASIQTLRALCMDEKLPMLLISSLNRESYSKPIRFEAFKETGSIEYSADEVFGLQFTAAHLSGKFDLEAEKGKSPRNVEIVILKQRYGASGDASVPFDYYAQYDCFMEKAETKVGSKAGQKAASRAGAKAGSKAGSGFFDELPAQSH